MFMMYVIVGGVIVLLFIIYYNDFDIDMYMRVVFELFFKKMIVGQFGKVFEMGKNFCNEGVDFIYNFEFILIEFYWVYVDMYDFMNIIEEFVFFFVKYFIGGYVIKFINQYGEEYMVNWEVLWCRVEMILVFEEVIGEKFFFSEEFYIDEMNVFFQRVCKKMGVECLLFFINVCMIDKFMGEFIEEICVNFIFILEYFQMMSFFVKYYCFKKGFCECFEVFVCKKEIVNVYIELNNFFD